MSSPGNAERPSGPIQLTAEAAGAIRFQEYGPRGEIEGVRRLPLRKHRDEEGWFLELYRLADGVVSEPDVGAEFNARQISASYARPDRINAFHIHPTIPQNEMWTVVHGQLLVCLVDCRADSSTAESRQRLVLSAEEPAALHIPAGVAHGYRAGPDGALLVYGMDQAFDPHAGNEGRLPWDHFGAELWKRDLG